MSRTLLQLTIFSMLFAQHSAACLWDSDTLRDEQNANPKTFELLTGMIPHHSDAYYLSRVERFSKRPNLSDLEKNDLAVAYIRLKQFDAAHKILTDILAQKPNDYFTLSNLGVLEKKRQNYSLAASYIKKALKINPDGHMGLGNWYLRQLQHRAHLQKQPGRTPVNNFLGHSYSTSFYMHVPMVASKRVEFTKLSGVTLQYLQRLIQNDRTFADGYVLFGDFLAMKGDLNLSLLAFTRAIDLGHRNPEQIKRRQNSLMAYLAQLEGIRASKDEAALDNWRLEKLKSVRNEIKKGQAWFNQFQKIETELVKQKGDFVYFDETLRLMKSSR